MGKQVHKLDIQAAKTHLGADPLFAQIIAQHDDPVVELGGEIFVALVRSVIHQQITGSAAASILTKLNALFPRKKPTPQAMLNLTDNAFQSAGVSPQKRKYLRDIAAKCIDGTINGKSFGVMSDSEVKEHLVAAKGIGSWTADMFLIFTLGRTDVLPVLDLGIQKGFQILFNLRTLPDAKKMLKLSKPWEGHRTVASLYLWKVADAHKERKKVKKQKQKVIKKRNLSK